MSEIDSAFIVILDYVSNPFKFISKLDDRFVELALKKVSKDSLKSELSVSMENIEYSNGRFTLKLLGHQVRLSYWFPEFEKEDNHIEIIDNDTVMVIGGVKRIIPGLKNK